MKKKIIVLDSSEVNHGIHEGKKKKRWFGNVERVVLTLGQPWDI